MHAKYKSCPQISDAEYIEIFKARSTVTPGGCWEWNGHCAKFRNIKPGQRGYPVASYRGKAVRLHRLMLTIFVRPLQEGEIGMHLCDNPPCWNPEHLKIGTFTENMRDCSAKGRADEQWKTHCKRGHLLSGGNLLWVARKGTDLKLRRCVICQRGRMRVRNGWPASLAFTLPPTSPGHRPVAAKWQRRVLSV